MSETHEVFFSAFRWVPKENNAITADWSDLVSRPGQSRAKERDAIK